MELLRSINQQTEFARKKLQQKAEQNHSEENTAFQGLLFVGNRHETVPFRLLTDKYLTPRAKTAWQMIKLNAQQFQGAAFPSYDELGYWLSDRAFQDKAVSRKIISQTLLLLRLTRWLTLCETVRNERGQVLGNVYLMNDEPLSILDCLQLNGDYLRLLEKATKHRDPLVQDVARSIVNELLEEKSLHHFISHLSIIRERYQQHQKGFQITSPPVELDENLTAAIAETQQILLSSNMELSVENRELSQKTDNSLSSNMELSSQSDAKSLILGLVPNWNSENTQYSTSTNNIKYSTGTDSQNESNLLEGLKLSPLEKETIVKQIGCLNQEMRDAVLFEARQRIRQGNVKRPAGYVMCLIRKAVQGDFNPYLITKSEQKSSQPKHSGNHPKRILSNPIAQEKNSSQYANEVLKALRQSGKMQ